MSSDEPSPAPQRKSTRDQDELVSQLTRVIRSNTNTLRQVHAVGVRNAQALAEAVALLSSLRDSSSSSADRVLGKVDVLLDVARSANLAAGQALAESRATNDRLGVTREEIGALRRDLTPAHGVRTYTPEELAEEDQTPVEIHKKGVRFNLSWSSMWSGIKKAGPTLGYLSGAATAAWHAFKHFLGH